LQRDPLAFLQEQATTYGDLSHFRIGPRHVYLVNHPELIKEVLTTQQASFSKGQALQRAKTLLGNGLLTSEGVYHLQQRRRIQPLFHRRRVAAYADCMVAQAARLTPGATREAWQPDSVIDMRGAMMKLTLAIVGETLFGRDLTAQSDAIGEAMRVLTRNFQRLLSPLAMIQSRLPTRENRHLRESIATLEQIVASLVETDRHSATDGGLVTMLVAAFGEEPLSAEEIGTRLRDEVLTLLLAGHETTANALSFTWWLLTQHGAIAERFYQEVDTVCQGRLPTIAEVAELRYTRLIFREALRLYPPAWTIGRQALAAVVLGGYTIPSGATVLLSPWVMHRDERYYANPGRFDPERWEAAETATRPTYAYFPFGGGARLCIGEQFAWMEGILLLATLGQRWRFQAVDHKPLAVQPGITLRPKERLLLHVTKR